MYTIGSVRSYMVYLILLFSILPIRPLIITGVKKWHLASISLFFERPSFQNEGTHSYQSIIWVQRWRNSVLPKYGAIWPTPSDKQSLKIHHLKMAKSSITHPWIDRSRSNLVHDTHIQHVVKVKGSKVKVTARHNRGGGKNLLNYQ